MSCRLAAAIAPAPSKSMRTLLSALALLFAEGAADELRGEQLSLDRGRVIAERECARCHAVGRTGQSPHAKAPPFRELTKRYPVEHLAEALVEGIVVGHGDMPEFLFEPNDVEAILAYMASLEK